MKKLMLLAALCGGLFAFAPIHADDVKKEDATYKKIESKLDSTVVPTIAYDEVDVTEVIKDFGKKGNITIVIDKKALEGVSADDRKITLELADIKLGNALNIVLDQIGLVKSYKNGVLYITTKEKAQGIVSTKTYDVRDITMRITESKLHIGLGDVPDAAIEQLALAEKADLFQHIFGLDVVIEPGSV